MSEDVIDAVEDACSQVDGEFSRDADVMCSVDTPEQAEEVAEVLEDKGLDVETL